MMKSYTHTFLGTEHVLLYGQRGVLPKGALQLVLVSHPPLAVLPVMLE